MSWFESVSVKSPGADPSVSPLTAQQAALVQLGAMSPLWMMFVGASAMGMAFWSMTRWMALATPERLAAPVVKLRLVPPAPNPPPAPEVAPEVAAEALVEAVLAESEVAAPVKTKPAPRKPAAKKPQT